MSEDDVRSATGSGCSIMPPGRASARRVGCSGSTARRSTSGGAARSGTGSRFCGRGSAAGRGCPTSCRRSWRSGSSPTRSATPGRATPDRVGAAAGALGRPDRFAQRCLALPASTRAQHAGEAAFLGRWLRGALPAAAAARAGAARRGVTAGGAGRDRLLLRRPAHRHEGVGLAADGDRRRLLVRVGGTRHLPARATRPAHRPQSSPDRSAPSSPPPAGGSSGSSATTAASSAQATSATPSASSASGTP